MTRLWSSSRWTPIGCFVLPLFLVLKREDNFRCWILLLLNIAVVVLSTLGAEKTGLSFLNMLSYVFYLVQVHNREGYLRQLVNSLSAARHIENTLLVFSHDVWDEQINTLVRYESSKHLGACWICHGFDVSGLSATSGSELDWSWSHNCQGDQAHAQAHGSLVVLLIMRLIMLMILVQDMLISGGSSSQWWFKCFTHSHCRLIHTHFQVSYKYKNSTIEEAEKRHAKR